MTDKESASKRNIPPALRQLLDYDVKLSKDIFTYFSKKYGFENYKKHLKYLELSCHGLIWLFGTFAMTYLFPNNIQVWINLLWLLILDIIVSAVFKAFIRRRRPNYNSDDMFFTVSVDKFSFPSGHSTRATVLAFFFAFIHPFPLILALMVSLWSFAVCISRVLLGRHHVLDIIGGIIIGYMEYLIIKVTYLSPESAASMSEYLFGEDPWSNA